MLKIVPLKLLLIIFVLLTLSSLPIGAHAYSIPDVEQNTTTLCQYQHTADYDYVAYLKPNEFYDNKLTLSPGEGALYTNLVENLKITFTYTFLSTETASIAIDSTITMDIEAPEQWTKSFTTGIENSISRTNWVASFTAELWVSVGWVENTAENIEDEIGSSSSTYNLSIKPSIHTVADNFVGTVDEYFTPELELSFTYGAAGGDQITVSGLDNTASDSIMQTSTTYRPGISNERNLFGAMFVIGFMGLVFTGLIYTKTKPEEPEKMVKSLVSPFERIILDVGSEPPHKNVTQVEMKSLRELVYIAEGLGKPVLHFAKLGEKEIHIFYVLDGPTKYEYVFELSKKSREE